MKLLSLKKRNENHTIFKIYVLCFIFSLNLAHTNDYVPKLPRIHKFLNYWHHEIDAVISQVYVSVLEDGDIKWQQIGHYSDNQIN